jgi:hypothetical protein
VWASLPAAPGRDWLHAVPSLIYAGAFIAYGVLAWSWPGSTGPADPWAGMVCLLATLGGVFLVIMWWAKTWVVIGLLRGIDLRV